jgi:hypothetical protein
MLVYEHRLNLERLRPSRGGNTAFFAFAEPVAARNYLGTNECHGWMGVKFQTHPRDEDSQVTIPQPRSIWTWFAAPMIALPVRRK